MKRLKKLLLGLVTFAAMAVLCAVCAGAETWGDYEYKVLKDGTVEITGYTGSATKLSIPSKIDGKRVSSIYGAFEDNLTLKSVIIPNTVKNIDHLSFASCKSLSSITIPNSVLNIGEWAFYGCSSLTSIDIPDSVISIGWNAFSFTPLIDNQNSSIKYIGNWIIDCDDSLTSAIIRNGSVGIADYAFYRCFSLTSITIPDSVIYIGASSFYSTPLFQNQSSSIKYAGKCAIECDKSSKYVTMNDNTVGITEYSFRDCTSLTSIKIPNNVKNIGNFAFYNCSSITEVKISDSVTSIGRGAFRECTSLKSVTLPSTVTDIGYMAFGYYWNGSDYKKISGFTIECYSGTAGETYAKENGFDYKLLKTTAPKVVTGLKLGGRASNALRLNWNKNTSASGYIIEQYKSGKWVRVAKITSNATTTYRVSGLAAGTAYKFRMKAYKMSGSTAIYGAYTSTLSARTNPSNVTGVKIGGKASTALRLNWTKNTSADGYIVEIYKGGKWVRAAKITKNTTVTYRISGLAKNTTYKIRIKAYKMSGFTALYSGYTTISGKTTA